MRSVSAAAPPTAAARHNAVNTPANATHGMCPLRGRCAASRDRPRHACPPALHFGPHSAAAVEGAPGAAAASSEPRSESPSVQPRWRRPQPGASPMARGSATVLAPIRDAVARSAARQVWTCPVHTAESCQPPHPGSRSSRVETKKRIRSRSKVCPASGLASPCVTSLAFAECRASEMTQGCPSACCAWRCCFFFDRARAGPRQCTTFTATIIRP